MSYLNDLTTYDQTPRLIQGNGPLPLSVANLYPQYEVQAPSYPTPPVYRLLLQGYKADELVFACVEYRANAISEPRLTVYQGRGSKKKELTDHPLTQLMDRPNTEMGELEFWKATEVYRCIAGFSIWEIEQNRMGEPLALWPLNPLWCSILRGPNEPIRVVRYQVPGLPIVDIPRERLLIFQEFDPQYPLLRSYSRVAAALRSINVHASVTSFLKLFFERGAVPQGLLSTTQQLQKAEGDRIKKQWREDNGGFRNWSDVSVIGNGLTYTPMQTNFKDMGFEAIDGRTESLICTTLGVSPLLMAVKVGLEASTLSNYDQATQQFLTQTVQPSWRWFQSEMTQQLLKKYDDSGDVYCEFDTSQIAGLQEDQNQVWDRALRASQQNLIYRDQFLSLVGLDPVDHGNKVFTGVTIRTIDPAAEEARVTNPDLTDAEIQKKVIADTAASVANAALQNPQGNQSQTQPPQFSENTNTEQMKTWRAQALAHIGQGVGAPFDAELKDCRSKMQVRELFEKYWNKSDLGIDPELAELNSNLSEAIKALLHEQRQTPISIVIPDSIAGKMEIPPAIVQTAPIDVTPIAEAIREGLAAFAPPEAPTVIVNTAPPDMTPVAEAVKQVGEQIASLSLDPQVVIESVDKPLPELVFTTDRDGRINGVKPK